MQKLVPLFGIRESLLIKLGKKGDVMSEFINLTDVVKDNIAASSLAVGETLTVRGACLSSRRLWIS